MIKGLDILTHSRRSCFKTCRRKHYYQYILGIRRDRSSTPLRVGGNVHLGLDWLAQGVPLDEVMDRVLAIYDKSCPAYIEAYDWAIECQKVMVMLTGYAWRWQDCKAVIVATERSFLQTIKNPSTKGWSRNYKSAGKIDKVVKLEDDRLAVREHKTTSDSIAIDSNYWKKVQIDQQITGYFVACQIEGIKVETIEYDVIHKPSIKPKRKTPEDKLRFKKNGEPYSTNRMEDEKPEDYARRLLEDIYERPEFYYVRQEVPRMQSDIKEFKQELWEEAQTMWAAERDGLHFRNSNACTSPYVCEYLDVCHTGLTIDDGPLPEGFIRVDNVHQELEENDEYAPTPATNKEIEPADASNERAEVCSTES